MDGGGAARNRRARRDGIEQGAEEFGECSHGVVLSINIEMTGSKRQVNYISRILEMKLRKPRLSALREKLEIRRLVTSL